MDNNWVKAGSDFFLRETSQQMNDLPANVFKLCQTSMGEMYLANTMDKFEFPYKIYGMEHDFIDRTIKTYNNTTGNLGMLLNGLKGTGKTVTAQMICNKLELPVIIIDHAMDAIPSFLNNIQQNVIVFFDEYEKMYNDYDHSILTVMDGVLNNGFRKVFMLTTNQPRVNDNMLQRPSRLRYIKSFEGLKLEHIIEVVDDKLVHTHLKKECIDFISGLELITIDIVKSVIEEVNIHEEDPALFKDIFNVRKLNVKYDVYMVTGNQEEIAFLNADVHGYPFDEDSLNENFHINGNYEGEVKMVIDENNIVISISQSHLRSHSRSPLSYKSKKRTVESVKEAVESVGMVQAFNDVEEQADGDDTPVIIQYRIQPVTQRNFSFHNYDF
jgi:hypothetical protein